MNKITLKENKISSFDGIAIAMVASSFLAVPVYGYILFIAYALINFKSRLRVNYILVLIIAALIYSVIKLITLDLNVSSAIIKSYFLFSLVSLLLIQTRNLNLNIKVILYFLIIIIIFESVLINSYIDRSFLPNHPKNLDGSLRHEGYFYGWYSRPYGPGGNASITSTALVFIYFIAIQLKYKLSLLDHSLVFISMILLHSGTGLLIYFIVISFVSFNIVARISVLPIVLIILFLFNDFLVIEKIKIDYILSIFHLKSFELVDQYKNVINLNNFLTGISFNHQDDVRIMSDFGVLDIVPNIGFIGLCIISLTLFFVSRNLILPVVVLVIGSLHYPFVFSPLGQFFLGILLAYSYGGACPVGARRCLIAVRDEKRRPKPLPLSR